MFSHAGETYEEVVGVALEERSLLSERLVRPKHNSIHQSLQEKKFFLAPPPFFFTLKPHKLKPKAIFTVLMIVF